jgi:hypothetical protein
MDSGGIKKKHSENIDYSFQGKMQRFLIAAMLADGIGGTVINIFFQNLYKRGIRGLGENFQSPSLVWGNSVSWNLLHFLLLVSIAGIFGLIFGYFSRKVSEDDKVLFGILFLAFHFFIIGVLLLIADTIYPGYWTDLDGMVNEIIFEVTASRGVVLFLILDSLGMIFSAIYFMKPGSRTARKLNHKGSNKKGLTFLGIRLYHYSWLWVTVILYSQIILNFLYQSGNMLVTLAMKIKGSPISGSGNAIKGSAIAFSWGNLFWATFSAGISIFLLAYLQKILSGKMKKNISITILLAVAIGFIIPLIIFLFTPFAG